MHAKNMRKHHVGGDRLRESNVNIYVDLHHVNRKIICEAI